MEILTINRCTGYLSATTVFMVHLSFSPGALAQKSCQPGKNVESWNFLDSYLGAHWTPWCKVKKIPAEKIFLFKMAVIGISSLLLCSKIMSYFYNICHRKTILVSISMCWKTGNRVKPLLQHESKPCRWKSNMAAITKRISLTKPKCDPISLSGWVGSHAIP